MKQIRFECRCQDCGSPLVIIPPDPPNMDVSYPIAVIRVHPCYSCLNKAIHRQYMAMGTVVHWGQVKWITYEGSVWDRATQKKEDSDA